MNLLQPQFMTLRLLQKLSRIVHVLLSLPMWVMLVKSSSIFFRKWAISYGRHTVPICGSPNNTTAGNSKKIRRRIESCFADLTRQDIEHTLTRSLGGLQMNIEAIMLTHNLEVMGMLQTSN